MKLSLITISSLIVLASAITQAEAADLPSKAVAPAAPVVVAPVFTWTGFYVGGELGWGQTRNKYTPGASVAGATTVVALPTLSKDGVLGGLFAGYNYQINQIVIGGELDGSFLIVGKERYTAVSGDQITAHTEWTGSARARLGYAVDHRSLAPAVSPLPRRSRPSPAPAIHTALAAIRAGAGRSARASNTPSPAIGSLALNTATRSTRATPTRIQLASTTSASWASSRSSARTR